MKLKLVRDQCGPDCQFGKLYVNGAYFCETLEDVVREVEGQDVSAWKKPGCTAIPRGTYRLVIDESMRFKRRLPRLLGVPGFTGIRVHPGNRASDSEGCILVGRVRGGDFVGDSRTTFNRLFARLDAAVATFEDLTIEIV